MKTIGTLFTGGALFDIGAHKAGYEHAWGIELDPSIAKVATDNGFFTISDDVRMAMENHKLHKVDHIHASPPCPNFSVAKQGGKETELDIELAEAVCWYIRWMKPETFSLENVTAYRRSRSLKIILACLHENGYMTDIQNLNSADFGVPQTRVRMILRAKLGGLLVQYPPPMKWKGWYDAVEDLIPTLPESTFAPWQIERLPKDFKESMNYISRPTKYNEKTARGGEFRDETLPAPTILVQNYSMKAFLVGGGNNSFQNAAEGRGVRYSGEPAFTITASQTAGKQRAFVGKVVKITLPCLVRFQTVPDWYKGITTKINGNGVPCDMAEGIMNTFRE